MAHISAAFSELWRMLVVFFAAFIPFSESKGAVIISHMLKLQLVPSGIVSATGAFVPIPFILNSNLHIKTKADAGKKVTFKKYIEKYGGWALLAMTAIPCTGVGLWLAAVLARLSGVDKKKAAAAIFVGDLIATLFVVAVVAGVKLSISRLF